MLTLPDEIAASIVAAGSKYAVAIASPGRASVRSVNSGLAASDSPSEASTATLKAVSVPTTSTWSSIIPAAPPSGVTK